MPDHAAFERLVMVHLDAGYNLARWLTHDVRDAEDVVQDACLRAMKYMDTLHAEDGRAWFLTIVRRAFYDWLARNRPSALDASIRPSPASNARVFPPCPPSAVLLRRTGIQ